MAVAALTGMIEERVTQLTKKFVIKKLFSGRTLDDYKNKDSVEKITKRYSESVNDINKAIMFSIGFSLIAFYAYLVLPKNGTLEVPLIGLSLSREQWIKIAPLILLILQIFMLSSLIWFLVLRLSLKVIESETFDTSGLVENNDNKKINLTEENLKFPNLNNVLLTGIIGHLWIIFSIASVIKYRLNRIWYYPLVIVTVATLVSPLIVSFFFVSKLFAMGNLILAIVYSLFFLSCLILYIALFLMMLLLGANLGWRSSEWHESIEKN